MEMSANIDLLAGALAKAQGEITGALKDSANPFFKSKYSDLASCWDACRSALSKNGLAVSQFPTTEATGTYLVTSLLHSSGQWMRSSLVLQPKDDSPQAMGSALTYARRYALCAVVGVAQVDDDGNAASGKVDRGHDPRGDFSSVPIEDARRHAAAMLKIMAAPAKDGDHSEIQKSLEALDYHEKYLNKDSELYNAVGEQLDAPKRNSWKALVNAARKAEKQDQAVAAAGRGQF